MTAETPLNDPQIVAQAARALFGDEWALALAKALGVNPRTIQRLAQAARAGQPFPIHHDWLRTMDSLMEARCEAMRGAQARIRTQVNVRSPVATGPAPHPPTQPDPNPTPTPPAPTPPGHPWTDRPPKTN